MVLRYASHRRDQAEKHKLGREIDQTRRHVEEPVAAE
jgi:hypothetical protein